MKDTLNALAVTIQIFLVDLVLCIGLCSGIMIWLSN